MYAHKHTYVCMYTHKHIYFREGGKCGLCKHCCFWASLQTWLAGGTCVASLRREAPSCLSAFNVMSNVTGSEEESEDEEEAEDEDEDEESEEEEVSEEPVRPRKEFMRRKRPGPLFFNSPHKRRYAPVFNI